MATKTHIGTLREQYTCNRQYIQTAFGWDDDAYNNVWIDMGCAYVDRKYNTQQYAHQNQQIKKDSRYWKWWVLEWKQRESKYLKMFGGDQIEVKDYINVMCCLLASYETDQNFEINYLKQ